MQFGTEQNQPKGPVKLIDVRKGLLDTPAICAVGHQLLKLAIGCWSDFNSPFGH